MAWTSRAHGHLGLPLADRPTRLTQDRDGHDGGDGGDGHDGGEGRDGGDGRDERAISRRRSAVLGGSWSWLRQVHGADVVIVDHPGGGSGAVGDALVTRHPEAVVAVFTADCAPVALAGMEGVFGVVHAGWRGLLAGVVGRAVEAMRALGPGPIVAALGPCIRAGCYEFGPADLDSIAASLGDTVRATSSWGTPALDLAAAVQSSLAAAGVELVADAGACTACSTAWFSYRGRADTSRQATLVWTPA